MRRGPGYMEVDIDVGSSSVAATVVNLVQGATKSLVVDMGIVLEGHSPEELPESLLGTVHTLATLFSFEPLQRYLGFAHTLSLCTTRMVCDADAWKPCCHA